MGRAGWMVWRTGTEGQMVSSTSGENGLTGPGDLILQKTWRDSSPK